MYSAVCQFIPQALSVWRRACTTKKLLGRRTIAIEEDESVCLLKIYLHTNVNKG